MYCEERSKRERFDHPSNRRIQQSEAQEVILVRSGLRAGDDVCTAEQISRACFNWCCPTPSGGRACQPYCYYDPDDW